MPRVTSRRGDVSGSTIRPSLRSSLRHPSSVPRHPNGRGDCPRTGFEASAKSDGAGSNQIPAVAVPIVDEAVDRGVFLNHLVVVCAILISTGGVRLAVAALWPPDGDPPPWLTAQRRDGLIRDWLWERRAPRPSERTIRPILSRKGLRHHAGG